MKIHNDVSHALHSTDKSATSKTSSSSAAQATSSAPSVGSVSISDVSRSLQAVGTSSSDAPFDAKRVEAIKAAISKGQFQVNPEAIADKVIDSATQLLASKS
jgi:negative regulator of flagellin synthesis FlgM